MSAHTADFKSLDVPPRLGDIEVDKMEHKIEVLKNVREHQMLTRGALSLSERVRCPVLKHALPALLQKDGDARSRVPVAAIQQSVHSKILEKID